MNQTIYNLLADITIPPMASIHQNFDAPFIPDPESSVNMLLEKQWVGQILHGKRRVGITVGSRGISNLKDIVRGVCNSLKKYGVEPIIIPSMGSHGGATPEGQIHVLEELGITEVSMKAKILSSTKVVNLGTTDLGIPVYYDELALSLDGVIVLNRIKAHTDLTGDIESGLQKMIAVGLGNPLGAEMVHERGLHKAAERVKSIASYALKNANILFGIGLLENAYDQSFHIEVIPADQIVNREPELLTESKKHLPTFLFNNIDVLIVDSIGKNISGDGMDPNIIGRNMIGYKNKDIHINTIVTLDLTPETGASALGVGLSDITTKRIYDKLDLEIMYINAITAIGLRGAHLPIIMDTDKLAIQLAIKSASTEAQDSNNLRIVRIKDTLHMDEFLVSKAILDEIRRKQNIDVREELTEMIFDERGNLV